MELIKVINARQVLDGLADIGSISAHLSYWMTKFVAKTESEQKFYVSEMRKILDEYAEQKEGEPLHVPVDKVADFNKAVEELNNTDVEDPGIKFYLSELTSEIKLSMQQMYPLLDFIDESK